MQRRKKLMYNSISSFGLQLVTILCGLVLPRLFIDYYGSEVNGLISSISRFLSLILLMEMGIGAVIQSTLYKPLADNDIDQISRIVTSGQKFYRKIAAVLLIYVVVLMVLFPKLIARDYNWMYTDCLIFAISISSFGQYYFGLIDQTLLNAAQLCYAHSTIRTVVLILNVVLSVLLIKAGATVQLVKLISSVVFVIQPLLIRRFTKKKYNINRKIPYNVEPIQQKWNGVAQHFSYVVLENTDTIVLTLLSTFSNVSIYSVYNGVVYGVKQSIQSLTKGPQHLIGDMLARKEIKELNDFFGSFECIVHMLTVLLFSCTGLLIIPFMRVYTNGIIDANYIQPCFAVIITLANALHTIRLPYNLLIMSAGHYKETQNCYIIATLINIILSVVLVISFGLVGVAIGTLVAMTYQTAWMVRYVSKNIINWPTSSFIKNLYLDIISVGLIIVATIPIKLGSISYISWAILGIKVLLISSLIVFLVFMCFSHDKLIYILRFMRK